MQLETKSLVRIAHQKEIFEKTAILNWCLGNTCNYSCSYCPEILHGGTKPWIDYLIVESFCERFIEHFKERNKLRTFVEFTGGEVTLFPDFLKVLSFLKARDVGVSIISNGSRRLEWWERAKPYLDHICLSFHAESAAPDHFKQVVNLLHDRVSVHVNVMMHPQHFKQCREIAEWLGHETENVSLAVQPLLEGMAGKLLGYSNEQLEFIKQPNLTTKMSREPTNYRGSLKKVYSDGSEEVTTAQQLIAGNENTWKGWNCWVGLTQLSVDFDGNVYRGWCKEGGKLGSVFSNRWEFPKEPIRCRKHSCYCVLDVMNKREL